MALMRRTHTCGELRETHVGQTVILNGWVNTYRTYNDQVFVDLRDRYGLTQVVFEADDAEACSRPPRKFAASGCWPCAARSAPRLPGKTNPKLATGDVEVLAERAARSSTAARRRRSRSCRCRRRDRLRRPGAGQRRPAPAVPLPRPAPADAAADARPAAPLNKVIRDYLDARRASWNWRRRSWAAARRKGRATTSCRAASSPAQLVRPAAVAAAVQATADGRRLRQVLPDRPLPARRGPAGRPPAGVHAARRGDVVRRAWTTCSSVIEGLTAEVFRAVPGRDDRAAAAAAAVRRRHAALRQRQARPALRPGDRRTWRRRGADGVRRSSRTRWRRAARCAASTPRGRGRSSRARTSTNWREHVKQLQGQGAWPGSRSRRTSSPSSIDKFLTPRRSSRNLRERLGAAAGRPAAVRAPTRRTSSARRWAALRTHLAAKLELVDPTKKDFKIAWVLDFPSFIWDDEEKRWAANHHPFTAPRDEDLRQAGERPGQVRAKAYDLVINGYEVGGGSIRIHNPEVQCALFKRARHDARSRRRQRFGFLLDALKFGAPPHGGIALGLDRWAMMLAGTTQHPRRDRLPEEPEGPRPDDRGAGRRWTRSS